MTMGFRPVICTAVLLCWALPLGAQQSIELEFNAGRVNLNAQNASVRVILSEWARLGGATIVNGEQVAGPAMTLELVDLPERQALDIILRNAAGYLLAPRRAGTSGDSAFDRVVILATSAAPRNPPPDPVAAVAPRPTLRRPPILVQPGNPDDLMGGGAGGGFDPFGGADAAGGGFDPFGGADATGGGFDPFGQGGDVPDPQQFGDPNAIPKPLIGQDPGSLLYPDDPSGGGVIQVEPAPAGAPTPSNPFGIPVGSSSRPGVIAPAPEPQQ